MTLHREMVPKGSTKENKTEWPLKGREREQWAGCLERETRNDQPHTPPAAEKVQQVDSGKVPVIHDLDKSCFHFVVEKKGQLKWAEKKTMEGKEEKVMS